VKKVTLDNIAGNSTYESCIR